MTELPSDYYEEIFWLFKGLPNAPSWYCPDCNVASSCRTNEDREREFANHLKNLHVKGKRGYLGPIGKYCVVCHKNYKNLKKHTDTKHPSFAKVLE